MVERRALMTASTWSHIRSFHLPYLREFRRLGWKTAVGCPGVPAEAPDVDEGLALPFEKRFCSVANFRAARTLRARLKREPFDLIVTHTSLAAFFTRLAVKGLRDRPKVINVVHGYLFDDGTPYWKRKLLLSAERLTAPQTDLLLTMNRWDEAAAENCRLGKRTAGIPGMGVDFRRLDRATPEDGMRLRRELGISQNAFVLLFAAEFSQRKSQHVLIEAMARLPEDAILVLCGQGVRLEDCRRRSEQLGLGDRVRFPGQVSDMPVWYRMADAAVTSSRSEGLPFNVMEAMYCGLPVIASAVKGHVDLVRDGETGLLYPYGDAEACAEKIRRVMEDADLRSGLRAAAADSVRAYGLDTVLPRVMEKYLSVFDSDRSRCET